MSEDIRSLRLEVASVQDSVNLASKKLNRSKRTQDGEEVVQQAYDFIDKKLSVDNARRFAFVNVHRMPRMSGNPIIVKFVSMIERDVVLRHAYRLQPRSGVGAKGAKPKFRLLGVTMTLYVAGKSYTTPDDYFKSSHQGQ
ncbi:hypothetical protein Bbelb_362300 [Branchiostoma belcheri]|nr:hypothetical protein Bbelb_362300 [Branchiostoma belcheri]